jgi:hypothetical protein
MATTGFEDIEHSPLNGGTLAFVSASVLGLTPSKGSVPAGGTLAFVSASQMTLTPTLPKLGSLTFVSASVLGIPNNGTPIKINCAVVVVHPGLPGMVILGRTDVNIVSLLDTLLPNATVNKMVYRTRPMQSDLPYHLRASMGSQEPRVGRKRVKRTKVYGEGTLGANSTITLHYDGQSQTFPVSGQNAAAGILISQDWQPIVGRVLDIELILYGTGIVIRDIEMDYLFVG